MRSRILIVVLGVATALSVVPASAVLSPESITAGF